MVHDPVDRQTDGRWEGTIVQKKKPMREIKYIIGNKFILEGDDVKLEREPDEKGQERKVWITGIAHNPRDRQPDGRWKGSIAHVRRTVNDIR